MPRLKTEKNDSMVLVWISGSSSFTYFAASWRTQDARVPRIGNTRSARGDGRQDAAPVARARRALSPTMADRARRTRRHGREPRNRGGHRRVADADAWRTNHALHRRGELPRHGGVGTRPR